MKVILLEDVENLGKRGEIKEVKSGFARNYLIPKGLAMEATPSNMRTFEAIESQQKSKKEKEKRRALKLKDKIEKFKLKIKVKASSEGKLFGAISSIDILNRLKEHGIHIEKGMIRMDDAIRTLGPHEVEMRLHPEVRAVLRVEVSPEGE